MHDSASTIIGFCRSPTASVVAPSPTSVPRVSRSDIRKRVRRIGRKERRSIDAMSSLNAIGDRSYGIDTIAFGALPAPQMMPAIAVTTMPIRIAPRTR